MYSVIAADGKAYGPVDVATLKDWCLQGRVTPETSVVDAVSGRTIRAFELQDLYGIFPPGPHQTPPPQGNYQRPPSSGYAPPPGSRPYGANQQYGNPYSAQPGPYANYAPYGYAPKSKILAIVLAFFLGHLGIHRYYLGHNSTGTTMLILDIVAFLLVFTVIGIILSILIWTALSIWAIVDIIQIAMGTLKDGQGYELTN